MKTLYDPYGRPIDTSHLSEELAAPVDYVRPVITDTAADWLTPNSLARMLQAAREGDALDFLTLADDMEEREPHYGSVLRTRKLAVSGISPQVKPPKDADAKATKIAEAVEELVSAPEFADMVADLLDALGKGYAVVEIMWDRSGKVWMPEDYRFRDPRFFRFDRKDSSTLRLLDADNMVEGVELEPYKFITHFPRLKSGLRISSGLARLAAVSYMCKTYALKDMMRFMELFGMPMRVGKYGTGAAKGDIDTLRRAVVNLGHDAAAVIPSSMQVEFIGAQAQGASSNSNPFIDIASWLDSQVSKAVLGQTMTTDDGASLSQAQVHDGVRIDISIDDARKLANTINRQLIEPWVNLNYGQQEAYPLLYFPIEDAVDVAQLSAALEPLVDRGLRVPQSWVRSKLGAPTPDEDEDVLIPASFASPEGAEQVEATAEANRAEPDTPEDEIDDLVDDAMGEWEPLLAPILDPVQKLLEESASFDEFLERLPELADQVDPTELTNRLALALFEARGQGDATDR